MQKMTYWAVLYFKIIDSFYLRVQNSNFFFSAYSIHTLANTIARSAICEGQTFLRLPDFFILFYNQTIKSLQDKVLFMKLASIANDLKLNRLVSHVYPQLKFYTPFAVRH
ncbi:hypothetical protein [Microbacter margulisiae]|uniref:Uncharacterized protein n=1 Tax=Microbacter margulisiae TaxID=1350067 RepID=A0A7W5DQZ9_9PORP|nr:hypothetical protein [Microbacter margulisiae]MBB3187103.1 hypothetical protein [Microbacter margulisiae]